MSQLKHLRLHYIAETTVKAIEEAFREFTGREVRLIVWIVEFDHQIWASIW